MANSYFRFKLFTIEQAFTAMKVGTDGVLLGAWADVSGTERILDIGTGTGLVALMAAQRNADASILGIDIANLDDATSNFSASPWADRLEPRQVAVQELVESNFDCILSNPPYFNNSLRCDNKARNAARHTDNLSFEELAESCDRLLADKGSVSLILPFEAYDSICRIFAFCGFSPCRVCRVRPRADLDFRRVLIEFRRGEQVLEQTEITLETEQRGMRTEDYQKLTKEFYLDK